MTKSIITFEELPDHIKRLKKRVAASAGQPNEGELKLMLKRAKGRFKYERRYRAGK